jgi:hypothetical protein
MTATVLRVDGLTLRVEVIVRAQKIRCPVRVMSREPEAVLVNWDTIDPHSARDRQSILDLVPRTLLPLPNNPDVVRGWERAATERSAQASRSDRHAHLGAIRHRSAVVEYRLEQHLDVLGDRLRKLGFGSVLGLRKLKDGVSEWARRDSNARPLAPEASALSN